MRIRVALGLLCTVLFAPACSKLTEPARQEPISGEPTSSAQPTNAQTAAPAASAAPAPAVPEGKLEMTDIVVGKGQEAKDGDKVNVHYVGTLTDGKEFDASKKHGDTPFSFELGKGRVIKGWDEGVKGMKVGGKRKLVIPPHLGYGARGTPGGPIPPNATLNFEVELVSIGDGAPPAAKGSGSAKPAGSAPAKPKPAAK
jgi:FKBP-type peptidyl-prolyl cis-trans isomerase